MEALKSVKEKAAIENAAMKEEAARAPDVLISSDISGEFVAVRFIGGRQLESFGGKRENPNGDRRLSNLLISLLLLSFLRFCFCRFISVAPRVEVVGFGRVELKNYV